MEKVIPTSTPQPVQQAQNIVKKFTGSDNSTNLKLVGIALLVILAGILTGGLLSGRLSAKGKSVAAPGVKSTSTEAGSANTETFKDTATGTLLAGGIKGEGTFHLERPGGETQTVYMTSTVIDLSTFAGKKVQIWGQTYAGKNTPWLMDVGRVKVVD